uniref:C2H2-type domain-containing protein n=1 Tax=Electrophorus electricus TaxID=8005 RepID=A0AAY5ETZ3_ELEEL
MWLPKERLSHVRRHSGSVVGDKQKDSPSQGTLGWWALETLGEGVCSDHVLLDRSDTSLASGHLSKVSGRQESLDGETAKFVFGSDSLEQIKAISKSFLSNSCWSSLSLHPQPCVEKTSENSSSSPGDSCYDWHQSAIAKTLQQVSEKHHPATEPNLFSSVQLYRQSARLYGSIFTGASKFHCKSCSASYDTLVDLTVHMNDTGHFRDDNHEKVGQGAKSWSKPRKRSLLEMEGKEDAEKVLRCMYCGHSFESLQDLSVHMIKTKHYQNVPLKEPGTSITAAKVISSFRKRAPMQVDVTKFNATDQKKHSKGPQVKDNFSHVSGITKTDQNIVTKSHILRCMECGSSCESLHQLTAHIMLTGHFVRGKNSLQIADEAKTKTTDEKSRTETDGPSKPTETIKLPLTHCSIQNSTQEDNQENVSMKKGICRESANKNDAEERYNISSKFDYLTEEDLKESPKLNLDILKSLEKTVTSAITKAQKGTPSWGGYPSIHAAYQLGKNTRSFLYNSAHLSSTKQLVPGIEIQSSDKMLISQSPPLGGASAGGNPHAVEGLGKKVMEEFVEEQMKGPDEQVSLRRQFINSPFTSADMKSSASSSPTSARYEASESRDVKVADNGNNTDERSSKKCVEGFKKDPTSMLALYDNVVNTVNTINTVNTNPEPKQPFVSPINALQTVMNLHLGKVAKPVRSAQDPMTMLLNMSSSITERAIMAVPPPDSPPQPAHPDVHHIDKDQPIDLSKGKVLNSSAPVSPAYESALSDISDMLRNLSDPLGTKVQEVRCPKSKPAAPSHNAVRSEVEGVLAPNEGDDASMVHKRKGRQSHWNLQHLLILQAQFTSGLRQISGGKYVISDLSPQERMVISRVTGLSMTTISHWLANVKYQLRRTGRTKFLKYVDSGHPVFFCSECAMQIQTRSTYLCHLESHLGFRMRDLAKFSCKNLNKKVVRDSKILSQKTSLSPSSHGAGQEQLYKLCKLCYNIYHQTHLNYVEELLFDLELSEIMHDLLHQNDHFLIQNLEII